MKLNYKKLGDYIEPCDLLNENEEITLLQGISNEKYFQGCKSNTNDIDLSRYRICRKGWFAYNRATTRNGDKISIAYRDEDDCLVSPSYKCFRIKDESLLNPYYLLLWFKRPQFDRYARFKSHGSAHEYFEYEEMCDVELPIPTIEEQKKIVQYYKVIENRISVLKQINDNLEATSLALFKSHFVTFEQYGGVMPSTWKLATIGDVVSVTRGASPRPIQEYMSDNGMPWVKISDASASVSKYLFRTAECITFKGVSSSRTVKPGMMIVSNSASPGLPMLMEITACVHDGWLIIDNYNDVTQEFMYYHFINERKSLVASSNGSVFNNLKTDIVKAHPIIIPDKDIMKQVSNQFRKLNFSIRNNAQEIDMLIELKSNLLSKLIEN